MRDGRLRALGVSTPKRSPLLPDVPTIGETVPGFEMSSWLGMFAPAGTPEPIIAKINETVRKILLDQAIKEKLAVLGLMVVPSTPAELSKIVADGLAVRGALIKAANIQPE